MSTVNNQVTDAITQLNALLSGGAAAQSMGMLDVTGTETIGMSMFNAVTAQQNAQTSASAAATASCAKMLNLMIPTPPPQKVLKPDDKKTIADLTHTIQALKKKEPAAASTTAGTPSKDGTDNASTK